MRVRNCDYGAGSVRVAPPTVARAFCDCASQLTATFTLAPVGVVTVRLPLATPVPGRQRPLPLTGASPTKRTPRRRNSIVESPVVVKLPPRRPGPLATPE